MDIPKNISNQISSLTDTLNILTSCYTIWSFYKKPQFRNKYLSVLNNYKSFFTMDIHSNWVALLMAACRLFETRNDTINFPKLIEKCFEEKLIDDKSFISLQNKLDQMKATWIKLFKIRGNVFAHLSNSTHPDDIFKKFGLKLIDIEKFVELGCELHNALITAIGKSHYIFGKERDYCYMVEMLDALEKGMNCISTENC